MASTGVDDQVVGAAHDLVIPVGRVVVVRALQVDVTTDGSKVLLVKGQIGGAADHVSPRSTPSGRWMVTLLAPQECGPRRCRRVWGIIPILLAPPASLIEPSRSLQRFAVSLEVLPCDSMCQVTEALSVTWARRSSKSRADRNARNERTRCLPCLLYPDDRHLSLEAGAVEILHRRIGVDGDIGRATDEQQVSAA